MFCSVVLEDVGTPAHNSLICCGDGFGEGISDSDRIKTLKLLKDFGADFNLTYNIRGYGKVSANDLIESRKLKID